jgi:hypothetical protein
MYCEKGVALVNYSNVKRAGPYSPSGLVCQLRGSDISVTAIRYGCSDTQSKGTECCHHKRGCWKLSVIVRYCSEGSELTDMTHLQCMTAVISQHTESAIFSYNYLDKPIKLTSATSTTSLQTGTEYRQESQRGSVVSKLCSGLQLVKYLSKIGRSAQFRLSIFYGFNYKRPRTHDTIPRHASTPYIHSPRSYRISSRKFIDFRLDLRDSTRLILGSDSH